jgi:uncharacterized metal-binding protein
MANQMALWLDRRGIAEMSCIAGVGGGVAGLVRTARSGRPIIALDGCRLHCVSACLANADRRADLHLTLTDYGVRQLAHADFDPQQARLTFECEVLPRIQQINT